MPTNQAQAELVLTWFNLTWLLLALLQIWTHLCMYATATVTINIYIYSINVLCQCIPTIPERSLTVFDEVCVKVIEFKDAVPSVWRERDLNFELTFSSSVCLLVWVYMSVCPSVYFLIATIAQISSEALLEKIVSFLGRTGNNWRPLFLRKQNLNLHFSHRV